jgi:hypothetical protein
MLIICHHGQHLYFETYAHLTSYGNRKLRNGKTQAVLDYDGAKRRCLDAVRVEGQ